MQRGSEHSPETKQKIRQALEGRPISAQHRNRISQARVGQRHSPETKAKIAAARRGKRLSEEALAKRRSKRPPPLSEGIRSWLWFLTLTLKAKLRWNYERARAKKERGEKYAHMPRNIGRQTLEQLARTLLVVGSPTDPHARRCFHAITALFFSRERLDYRKKQSLKKYAALLPDSREGLMRVMWAVEVAQEFFDGFATASFSVPNFLAAAEKMPLPDSSRGLVEQCLSDERRRAKNIGAIFTPNTVDHHAKTLRGVFGDLVEMSDDHAEQIERKLRTVR